jgi:hypothetical protein
MPCMIRPQGKAKKIAFKLLGVPANMTEKKSGKDSKVSARLVFEETRLMR